MFNINGDDSEVGILNITPTGILNLDNVKYKWANNIYKKMLENFWQPHVISLVEEDINKLTKEELKAFKYILSFLIYLDSIQLTHISNCVQVLQDPVIKIALSHQAFQESIHATSYQYIIQSLFNEQDRRNIYYLWREDELSLNRIQLIQNQFTGDSIKYAGIYHSIPEDKFLEYKNILCPLINTLLIEGLYFQQGFQFFYILANRQLLTSVNSIIILINRDEDTHTSLWINILKEVKLLYPEIFEILFKDLLLQAVKSDISWSLKIFDNILGINNVSISEYLHYLSNMLCKKLNLNPIFQNTKNPYKHLEVYNSSQKGNFFTSSITDYTSNALIDDL